MSLHVAYVGLGANLGDAAGSVERALHALGELGRLRRRSSLYRTPPWGKTDQPAFVNAVALLETALTPQDLLEALQRIEVRLGRQPTAHWGPRVIDLDLLLYDDLNIDEPDFHVPHARMYERAFVLVPLSEIDARYRPLLERFDRREVAAIEKLGR
jgi:2-amino-4-hydroxy-6-hydroxymethyldihydropteridine diphosphokinase